MVLYGQGISCLQKTENKRKAQFVTTEDYSNQIIAKINKSNCSNLIRINLIINIFIVGTKQQVLFVVVINLMIHLLLFGVFGGFKYNKSI